MPYLVVFLAAFFAALLLTPIVARLSLRLQIVAQPGGRRRHQGLIPKLGGVAILTAFAIGVGMTYWLSPPARGSNDARRLGGVLLGSLVVFAGGLVDDWRDLRPRTQLLVQIAGAAVAMSQIIFIEVFTNPFSSDWLWTVGPLDLLFTLEGQLVWMWRPLALLFTLFWIMSMINTVNMLDGLDGLAAGVGTIAALLFAWHSYRLEQTTVPLFPLALAGALLGFLRYNFAPARIFLGSAGAYFLGFNLAALSILSPAKLSTALLVMAVPILDVAWQIINRLRRGQHPFQGDRGHLHFRLSDGGLPTRWIVSGYYTIALIFGLVAIFAGGLVKLLLLLLISLLVLVILVLLSRRAVRVGLEANS
jgi:UDP-GlcNAc:undecaprenyl-phosphate GlcNAc-1-phosphate transferase